MGLRENSAYLSMLAAAAALGLENVRLYEEMCEAANRDPVTEASTRRVVMEEIEDLARRPPQDRNPFAVLLVDLDHFKAVNDTLGHQAGDSFLKEMVDGIRRCLRPGDLVGRYGGDEFLVVLPSIDLRTTERISASIVAELGRRAVQPRWAIVPVPLGATVGLTWWDGGPIDAGTLTALADSSLYGAKASGRSRVGIPAIRESAVR